MKDLVIPTLKCNVPEEGERPDKLLFVGENNTCGGQEFCAGRRMLENVCNALSEKKGHRGMDPKCINTMIKVQLEALNKFVGIPKGSRDKQRIRVEDVEEIIQIVREENYMCIVNREPELTVKEAFKIVTDLLLEKLYLNRYIASHFFGIMATVDEAKSFKDLDPQILGKVRHAMTQSLKMLVPRGTPEN